MNNSVSLLKIYFTNGKLNNVEELRTKKHLLHNYILLEKELTNCHCISTIVLPEVTLLFPYKTKSSNLLCLVSSTILLRFVTRICPLPYLRQNVAMRNIFEPF